MVHTHGRCSGQDEGATGNVKRCGQVYVCISTAVKNRSVILYFCGSKLLDLFLYLPAHLTTATHLSVSLAPMPNFSNKQPKPALPNRSTSEFYLLSFSFVLLFLWLLQVYCFCFSCGCPFCVRPISIDFFRAVVQEHLLQSTYCFCPPKIQSALISRPFGTIQKLPRKWPAVFSEQTGSGFKGAFIIYCVYGQLETRWSSSHSCDTSL